MAEFLERYLQGDHESVWAELVALGSEVLSEQYLNEAKDVARETMRRVRWNLDLLIPRLRAQGYRFGDGFYDDMSPEERVVAERETPILSDPSPDTPQLIDQLEQAVGMLPLSLRAWYETFGSVNLVGKHPRWRLQSHDLGLDPLFVYSIDVVVRMVGVTSHEREADKRIPAPVSPDRYFKYGYSGGGSYFISVPLDLADGQLEHEWGGSTFVAYLRRCCRWAGFPGLEREPDAPLADIALLQEGFLPL